MLSYSWIRCACIPEFETKTYYVGERIILKCPRQYELTEPSTLHWIRFLSGNLPEFLGATYAFDYEGVNKTPHFTTKQDKGTFDLIIDDAKPSDTGFYYCVKTKQLEMEFTTATFLQINALSVESPDLSGTVDSGDSVDLQCWVQTENAQCFKEHMVLWFRSGLDQSSPGLVYAQRNSSGQCDRGAEDQGPHKCFYTFSKSMSPSDAGTYRCAVAACGQILFGNKTKEKSISEKAVLTVLSVALTMSLIVIIILICYINKRSCVCFYGERQNVQTLALNGNLKRFCFSWTKSKRRNDQR
uniref:Ig-like domain-containing protein n=1 Tax=Neogobius melanostomus TaxID=47308 RepID=A0A8C6TSJ0_9GOBI